MCGAPREPDLSSSALSRSRDMGPSLLFSATKSWRLGETRCSSRTWCAGVGSTRGSVQSLPPSFSLTPPKTQPKKKKEKKKKKTPLWHSSLSPLVPCSVVPFFLLFVSFFLVSVCPLDLWGPRVQVYSPKRSQDTHTHRETKGTTTNSKAPPGSPDDLLSLLILGLCN